MTEKPTELDHGMLLDAKDVMDNAMPELQELRAFVPEKLHDQLETFISKFEAMLASADVSERYEEKS